MRDEDDIHEPEHDHLLDNEYLEDEFDAASAEDYADGGEESEAGPAWQPCACCEDVLVARTRTGTTFARSARRSTDDGPSWCAV